MVYEGLKQEAVDKLALRYGKNVLPQKESDSGFLIFLRQFKSPLIYILLIAAIISIYAKEFFDVYLILAVVAVDVSMGFYQEFRAHKTFVALKNILQPTIIAIRNNQKTLINVQDLVPEDIVVLGSGDKIPADGELISGVNFLVNEAILTGEQEAVEKDKEKNKELFMGTVVLSGSGIMKVQKIGASTAIGKIGKSLSSIKQQETPIQKKLSNFAKNLILIIIGIALIIFIVGYFLQGRDPWEMLRTSIVLAVAATPEGLPIAVTMVMALGMSRILRKKGLVKRLISIETLGATTIICTDKTGTLTEGKMQVVKTDFVKEKYALMATVLDNDQRTNLEIALLNYAKKQNLPTKNLLDSFERIYQEPFNSVTKYSLSVNQVDNKNMAFMMGAPDIIINFCKLSPGQKQKILQQVAFWADEGLRVLGVAINKEIKDDFKNKKNYEFLGLIGIQDPLRSSVKNAIAEAQHAGVKTKIVTGDYLGTAISVAKELNLRVDAKNVMEGYALEKISNQDLAKIINDIDVFARVTPQQKLKIVEVLQAQNEIVAMTGDGVNDSPALKKADIGVVVGSDASEVAKETGDLILLDGNFKTILNAIEEGRLVFANLKKVIGYILSNSFAEIILIFSAMILDLPSPLTVVQILWTYLICDGPPDVLLSFEPKESYLMKTSPKVFQKEQFLDSYAKTLIVIISSIAGLSALVFFYYYYKTTNDINLARTVAFATIGAISLIYIFSFKSLKKSLFKTENFFANKYLIYGVIYGWVLLLSAIYLPILNKLLNTVPLKITYWIPVLSVGILVITIVELTKLFRNHKENGNMKTK